MQNSTEVFTFFGFHLKYLFWAFLVQKIKIVCSNWNYQIVRIILEWIEYMKFSGSFHCICFRLEIPFLGKFDPENENCQFQLKFASLSISNTKNSMLIRTLSIFERKYPLYGKFVSKTQNCWLKLAFRIFANSNICNSMVIFILFFFKLEIPFLVQKIKLSV